MVDVLQMGFTREHFIKMTKEERALFLLLGSASNQANVLWKVIIVALNRDPEDKVDQKVSAAQAQILVRLVVGVLWEAWRLVETRFISRPLGKEYLPLLDKPAAEALSRLKKRFGSSNMISKVRNTISFHHPTDDEAEAAFQSALKEEGTDDSDWALYFSNTLLNCFFFASDHVIAHGVAQAAGETNLLEGHKRLLPELGPVANDLSEFTFGFAAALFRKYIGNEIDAVVVAKIKATPIDDLQLPFYVVMQGQSKG